MIQRGAIVLVILLAGCASMGGAGQSLAVSGEALKAVGNEFVAVANVYKTGCDAKTIAEKQCLAFREFGVRFKGSYPLAIGLWESARAANDGAASKKAEQVIGELAAQLSALAVQGIATFSTTGGGK
jgi:hypothetical protein